MSDTAYPIYQHYGTAAQRGAFTPSPPASGQPIYIWYETDTGKTYLYDTSWHLVSNAGSGSILTGSDASKGTGTAGDLFLPNDGFQQYRSTGSAQAPWGPLFPFTAPVDGDFAWVNQGGASVDTTNGGIYLLTPASATANIRIRKKAAPATPYTITAAFIPAIVGLNFQSVGLLFRESSSGKLQRFCIGGDTTSGYQITSIKWTNETTFSADYVTRKFSLTNIIFMRIADNGTNRICSYSMDGQHWIQFHSVGRTDFLTANEVGFSGDDETNIYTAGMTLLSWKQA